MKILPMIGAALALAIPATAYAAADCCKDGADCCKGKQADKSCCDHDEQAGGDMPSAPAK